MNSENDLMQKLMMSKKIMDKHNDIGRGQARNVNSTSYDSPLVENFSALPASYNIPEEYLQKEQTLDGSGVIFKLSSLRSNTIFNAITTLIPNNGWKNNDTVWADNEYGENQANGVSLHRLPIPPHALNLR